MVDSGVRVLLWHGWLLEGSGSSVITARVAETLRGDGHDVALVCQQRDFERYPWIDAWATVDRRGVAEAVPNGAARPARGRCTLLRPAIGATLPVFVLDAYEGFEVRRFVDLGDATLAAYLDANVDALRSAVAWHRSDVAIAGHAIPGGAIARRALGDVPYVVSVHGSDLEYAIRAQRRFVDLAFEGLAGARAIAGPAREVLDRCRELVPGVERPTIVVPPGVDADAFRPMPRREALLDLAQTLERDPDLERGRPSSLDVQVRAAVAARDGERLDALAETYDQGVPEPVAPSNLRALAERETPIVGSFGKLIPQKGVHLLLASAPVLDVLVVGFGSLREWLGALSFARADGDADALGWLASRDDRLPGLRAVASSEARVSFTGRLDHRYAPNALAAMDVLVVPSILGEAFGMVAAEGAAAGALPLVSRHSGLAEIAAALEAATDRPGWFSFDVEPDADAGAAIAGGLDRLLGLPPSERTDLAVAVHDHVARTWSWRATAERLLAAASAS
jgi:glycosyltransferase involved in cell wall biosynthesis